MKYIAVIVIGGIVWIFSFLWDLSLKSANENFMNWKETLLN